MTSQGVTATQDKKYPARCAPSGAKAEPLGGIVAQRSITIEHNGRTYGGQMATIKSTSLGTEDHGIVVAYLHCEWPGGGIGVGGMCLDAPVKGEDGRFSHREGTAYGLDHIMRLAQTVGVDRWEQLPGKHVIVLFEGTGPWLGSMSVGIAHPTDDKKVLILKDHADKWLAAKESADERVAVTA